MLSKDTHPFTKRCSLIGAAIALSLGTTTAGAATMSSATFTMLSAGGGTVGTDTTVTGSIGGGTFSVASTTPFFGLIWTAHSGTTFGPGTYSFATIEGGTYTGVVVGADQVGGHILFDWGVTTNIDVVMVWDVSCTSQGECTYSSSDPVVAGPTPNPDGIRGVGMIDGAFPAFNANFDFTVPWKYKSTDPINMAVKQGGVETSTISPVGGTATIETGITSSGYTFDWSGSDTSLLTAAGGCPANCSGSTFSFDPSSLSGNYKAKVKVSKGGDFTWATLNINVLSLSTTEDTDGDGIIDSVDGATDSDGDGIPDFLDNNNLAANKLAITLDDITSRVMVASKGILGIGSDVLSEGINTFITNGDTSKITPQVTMEDLGNVEDPHVDRSCVGGCYDFIVKGLDSGDTVNVVIPLSAAIPTKAVYRKFVGGKWNLFDYTDTDRVSSAAATAPGVCPEPGSSSYKLGLNSGDYCVQLTLTDGGPNDADGTENGTIADPGGVAEITLVKAETSLGDSGFGQVTSGCTLGTAKPQDRWDLWLLLAGLAGLGVMRRKSRA